MPSSRPLTERQIEKYLEEKGVERTFVLKSFLSKARVTRFMLDSIFSGVKPARVHDLSMFLITASSSPGFKSMYRYYARHHKSGNSFAIFVRMLWPRINSLLDDPRIQREGFHWRLAGTLDEPQLAFQLTHNDKKVARFSVEFYFNAQRKPSILFANMQGYDRALIERFKKTLGHPLYYFLRHAEKQFPLETQRLALHPNYHTYNRGGINSSVVLGNLVTKGVLEREDMTPGRLLSSGEDNKRIKAALRAEMERIKTDATILHRAAYKKAGYKHKRGLGRFLSPRKPSRKVK